MDQKSRADAIKCVEEIQKICDQVKGRIAKSNVMYQAQDNKNKKKAVFEPGDLVWVHLIKERFSSKHKNKLMPRGDDSFEVSEWVNDNACKVDSPRDYGILATFNVDDLSPYWEDNYLNDLRSNPLQQGEDDRGPLR